MSKMKVLITDGIHPVAKKNLLEIENVDSIINSATSVEELQTVASDVDIVVIRSATKLTKETLDYFQQLKLIIRAGVGVDNIDLSYAREKSIFVTNAPNGNFQSTAEMAMGLIFSCARKIPQATIYARDINWQKKKLAKQGRQINGSNLGIFGAGNIGMRLANMAKALGMNVSICDPVYSSGPFEKVNFEQLCSTSDFISIHAPILDSTKHIFNTEAFKNMKETSYLINAARGGIVNDNDLLLAIKNNVIAGAALDVYEVEPYDKENSVYQELLVHENIICTPHMGASTIEAQKAVGLESVEKIKSFLVTNSQGKPPVFNLF